MGLWVGVRARVKVRVRVRAPHSPRARRAARGEEIQGRYRGDIGEI